MTNIIVTNDKHQYSIYQFFLKASVVVKLMNVYTLRAKRSQIHTLCAHKSSHNYVLGVPTSDPYYRRGGNHLTRETI